VVAPMVDAGSWAWISSSVPLFLRFASGDLAR
jgi:hypothetical protein